MARRRRQANEAWRMFDRVGRRRSEWGILSGDGSKAVCPSVLH